LPVSIAAAMSNSYIAVTVVLSSVAARVFNPIGHRSNALALTGASHLSPSGGLIAWRAPMRGLQAKTGRGGEPAVGASLIAVQVHGDQPAGMLRPLSTTDEFAASDESVPSISQLPLKGAST